ncbi:MAG TPA: toll/interleukin-1 receptor domain-containing protein [Blastocatellia bacterium]|nr:toll/interleukin-1 receptor domain-containing protein [Blastocatellia bacterium]
MANKEDIEILKQGVKAWNEWRENSARRRPNLNGANLRDADLSGVNFFITDLIGANLSDARLYGVDFTVADLSGANLSGAGIRDGKFLRTTLRDANFAIAIMSENSFAETDLSSAKGLDSVAHVGPSYISIDTLYKSRGQVPKRFLQGCGVPDDFITFLPSHFGNEQAIQFYSCFISYSEKDKEFAKRLYFRMRNAHLRVWFAPEDIQGGKKVHEQLERAIQMQDRLLIVLSESSMRSEWVMTEIRNARHAEIREGRRKLFPIRLVNFDAIKQWRCFDADTGKDLAVELREYFIPDFSNWKDYAAFEDSFDRLLRDLKR